MMVATADVTATQNENSRGVVQASSPAALIRQNSGSAILSLAEKSGNPMQFLAEMGKHLAFSGMLGLKKPEQGSTLLLICMTENKTPLSVIQEYHLMDDGKMTKKADWVIARFREIGGKYKIIADGEDEQIATYEFTFAGNTMPVSYSIEDAKKEGLLKAGSRWMKNPASMLRARVITKGVRMIAPEVMAGFLCEEELDDAAITPAASSCKPKTSRAATTVTAAPAASDPVINATVEPDSDQANEAAPFDATDTGDSASDITTVLAEIELTLGEIGMTKADLETGMKKKNSTFTSLDNLEIGQAKQILERLRAKKQASQAG